MTLAASYTGQLVEGFAQYLAAAGIGLAWQPDGVYTDLPGFGVGPFSQGPFGGAGNPTPIFVMAVPQSPDRLVTLSPIPMSADPILSESEYQLQVRCRSAGADPRDVWLLDDAVQQVLLGNYPLTLPGGITVELLQFLSGGSLGQDENSRWQSTANYHLVLHRPSPHRT